MLANMGPPAPTSCADLAGRGCAIKSTLPLKCAQVIETQARVGRASWRRPYKRARANLYSLAGAANWLAGAQTTGYELGRAGI